MELSQDWLDCGNGSSLLYLRWWSLYWGQQEFADRFIARGRTSCNFRRLDRWFPNYL